MAIESGLRMISIRSNMNRPMFLMIVSVFLVSAPMVRINTSPIGFCFSISLAIMSVALATRCMAPRIRLVARSRYVRV